MGCNTSFAVRAFWNVTICKNKGKGANPFPCFAQNTMGLLEIYFIKLFHRLGADNAISSKALRSLKVFNSFFCVVAKVAVNLQALVTEVLVQILLHSHDLIIGTSITSATSSGP